MLLTLTTTARPATDLGYLLNKTPARAQSYDLAFGRAHVFYPEASEDRCTAALLLDVDPVGLVRGRSGPAGDGGALEQYVNDRPYVASSFLSVAIAQVFGTAMSGRSKERPELTRLTLPFEVRVSVLPCRGGEPFLRKLFEPLGYSLTAVQHPLDETVPEWGPSRYLTVTLRGEQRLAGPPPPPAPFFPGPPRRQATLGGGRGAGGGGGGGGDGGGGGGGARAEALARRDADRGGDRGPRWDRRDACARPRVRRREVAQGAAQ